MKTILILISFLLGLLMNVFGQRPMDIGQSDCKQEIDESTKVEIEVAVFLRHFSEKTHH